MNMFLAPQGRTYLIVTLSATLSILVNFQEAYSNSYPNTAYYSFQTYINESYILRGNVDGMSEDMYTWVWSLILNIWFLGYLFGVFFTPYMTDNYGRKTSLILANMVSLLGTVCCATGISTMRPELFFLGRIVASASCGVSFITLILFLQETTPTSMRGVASFLSETAFIFVSVIGMGCGLNAIFGLDLYKLVAFAIIPGIAAVLIMFPLKETPKFLLIHRKDKKAAIEALKYYRGYAKNYDDIIANILKECDDKLHVPLWKALNDVLFTPHLRKALLLGIASLQLVVGIWPIVYLSTDILETHFSNETAQYASFAFIIANFLASTFGLCYVDQFGRRPMMLGAGILNTGCLISYIVFDRLAGSVSHLYRYGCVASLIGFGITYGGALGPIAIFISSELVAQRYRSLMQSIVFGMNTSISFVLSFVTLPMYKLISAWSFIPLFIIPSILALTYLYRNLPETKGREIHDIVAEMIQNENPILFARKRVASRSLSTVTMESCLDEESEKSA
uniref:MFS domain-containing protein n=1 Tax=Panagrellus redivivus TaxID=6233 RepID=A0A7E4VQ82_PANRE